MNGERISELLDRGTLLGQVFTPVRGTAHYFCKTISQFTEDASKRPGREFRSAL